MFLGITYWLRPLEREAIKLMFALLTMLCFYGMEGTTTLGIEKAGIEGLIGIPPDNLASELEFNL